MYDNLALLLLGSSGLRLGGVEGAELEMGQICVRSMLGCLCLIDVLLVQQRSYAQAQRFGLRPAAVCERRIVGRRRCEVP